MFLWAIEWTLKIKQISESELGSMQLLKDFYSIESMLISMKSDIFFRKRIEKKYFVIVETIYESWFTLRTLL